MHWTISFFECFGYFDVDAVAVGEVIMKALEGLVVKVGTITKRYWFDGCVGMDADVG